MCLDFETSKNNHSNGKIVILGVSHYGNHEKYHYWQMIRSQNETPVYTKIGGTILLLHYQESSS